MLRVFQPQQYLSHSNSGSGLSELQVFDPQKLVAITHLFLQCIDSFSASHSKTLCWYYYQKWVGDAYKYKSPRDVALDDPRTHTLRATNSACLSLSRFLDHTSSLHFLVETGTDVSIIHLPHIEILSTSIMFTLKLSTIE